jgi:hypothetical protein
MSPTFRKFGYELYPTSAMAAESGPYDPKLQLKNHRYRYEALAGSTLTVSGVEKAESGYVVRMEFAGGGKPVFAATQNGAVKGIAHAADRENALRRWKGKTVYARKRQINTYDSPSGRMGSIKVSLSEPLEVTDVRWGTLPLPPQPLWLMVRTGDGREGFVPVRSSWTNVIDDRRGDWHPWRDFVLEQDPRQRYSWDEEMWQYIDTHKLVKGMTGDQARLTWGEPLSRDSADHNGRPHARWLYQGQQLYLLDGKVVAIEPR